MPEKLTSVSQRDEHLRGILEMFSSLLTSVDIAGGTFSSYTWDKLQSMSAADLIERLGPNKVRFTLVE